MSGPLRSSITPLLRRAMSATTLKPRLIAQDLMKKRTNERDKKIHDLNVADIQVIGSSCESFSPSLLVTSGGVSHMFNCSEGIQRLCYANKVKLANLENLFITNFSWDRISGLLGLVLTLQDLGAPKLDIYSSTDIKDYFRSTSLFMSFYTGMKCNSRDCSGGLIKESGIQIQPILIDAKETVKLKRAKLNPSLVAYVCQLPNILGPLDPQKCKELKVPIGPKLALLKSGQDVELQDGTVVRSAQVCGPPRIGMKFIVLECPRLDDLDDFVNNSQLKRALDPENDPDKQGVELVIHFSPKSVTTNLRYRNWIESFGESCRHLFVPSQDSGVPNFIDTYRLLQLLNLFDPEIFPLMYMPKEVNEKIQSEVGKNIEADATSLTSGVDDLTPALNETLQDFKTLPKLLKPNSLDRLILRPKRELLSVEQTVAIDLLLKDVKLDPNFEDELEKLRRLQVKLPKPRDYEPELLFLGTGSAIPSKLRNTSNILINLYYPKQSSVMLDCGEDSYGQLCRHYGPTGALDILSKLKLIYVSHHHADHHIGLIKLLAARKKASPDPLILLLPPNIEELLKFYNQNFDDLSSTYRTISTRSLKSKTDQSESDEATLIETKRDLLESLGDLLADITIVPVVHCSNACAVVLKFNIGHDDMKSFTVAYSGDARPSQDLIVAGKNCDLLIHEATFDFRHPEDALAKKHCTSTEAIEVSRQMQSKFTILTHFSQRLAKVPYFDQHFDEKIGFSFDHLKLRCPSHFDRLPILKPILSMAFKKSLGEMDLKHMKDQLKFETISKILESQTN